MIDSLTSTMYETLTEAGSILDQLSPGVMVTGEDWRVRYVNRSLTQALNRTPEDMIGEHLLVLAGKFGERDSCGELLRWLARLTQTSPQKTVVHRVQVCVPERHFIRFRVQPYRPDGGVGGYLFLVTDATKEGEIDEMKNEFVSVASHEMRTPMTSIKGSLELLLGGYAGELPAEATELLGISLTAVDRLVRLINDLLDISKIESGKMEFHLDRLNIHDCIQKSMRSLRALAEAHKVSIKADLAEGMPAVMADRDRMEQVITNLLSNALKYTNPGTNVVVETQARDRVVRVSVIDHGPGIAKENLEKVFDRFYQLAGSKKGTGLGLTICRALVEQHRGRIWVESEMGHGSQFHIELPAAPPE